ncbi:uncharacterized protein BX664DRAFT_266102, partial [Halteromyces radiatus]|uniref:uncharacterized protein n=1 Tax=Halteromyces radiatus TaxID=101107 RepID=UPI002220AB18
DPWYVFLQAKIKLEHLIYKEFYQSRLNKRLLHQGASALDIIQQYLSCIRLMKLVDPSCAALLPIVRQVESYMMTYRNDTEEGVVEVIRQAEEYDLMPLDDQECYVFPDSELNEEVISILDESGEDDTLTIAELERLQRKATDLVAMLISMCGSRTKFVEGYKKGLAKSLMTIQDYDTDQEMILLEMLKQRFPEYTMNACDIMIKDINDSRRINRQVHEDNPDLDDRFKTFILSKEYWPKIEHDNDKEDDWLDTEENTDPVKIPTVLEGYDGYAQEYRKIKPSRHLIWLPSHGSVTLELELDGCCKEFIVEPPAALVISLFEKGIRRSIRAIGTPTNFFFFWIYNEDEFLTTKQVIEKTGLQLEKVMMALNYWHKQRILVLQANGYFRLLNQETIME